MSSGSIEDYRCFIALDIWPSLLNSDLGTDSNVIYIITTPLISPSGSMTIHNALLFQVTPLRSDRWHISIHSATCVTCHQMPRPDFNATTTSITIQALFMRTLSPCMILCLNLNQLLISNCLNVQITHTAWCKQFMITTV